MSNVLNKNFISENIKMISANHNETAWERELEFEYDGERYSCLLSWDLYSGYDVVNWYNVPDFIKSSAHGFICHLLDELSLNLLENEVA